MRKRGSKGLGQVRTRAEKLSRQSAEAVTSMWVCLIDVKGNLQLANAVNGGVGGGVTKASVFHSFILMRGEKGTARNKQAQSMKKEFATRSEQLKF